MTLSMCPFCGNVYDASDDDEHRQRLIAKGEGILNVDRCLHDLLIDTAPGDNLTTLRDGLLKVLRPCGELSFLADMLDPKGRGAWKLELKRRKRGRKSKVAPIDALFLEHDYSQRVEELEREGARSPGKQALAEMAKLHKLDDDALYKIIKTVWRERKGRNST
jgi:hypothetical protein